MRILKAKEKNFELLKQFVLPYEISCMQLCAHIKKKSENIFVVVNDEKLCAFSDIYGVFYFDGSMHHCLPFLTENELLYSEFAAVFMNFLDKQKKSLKYLNGQAESTRKILEFLNNAGIKPYQDNLYFLMILKTPAILPPVKLMNDDFIKHCSKNDREELFDLQKKYLMEEVAPKGKKLSDAECSLILDGILKNQICSALVSDGKFVSKVNTNAVGWNFIQIGGVYTEPIYRRNYYAWHLIYELCEMILKKNKNVSLFVKENNSVAFDLYKKIGFLPVGRFEICYF